MADTSHIHRLVIIIDVHQNIQTMQAMIETVTRNEDATRELGKRIGQLLEPGSVVALNGTLGAGKTRLTQGIGAGLDVRMQSIVSPTYTICVPYAGRLPLVHLDAYRIKDASEVDELGLDELLEEGAVLVVEWADRIEKYLPPVDINIEILHDVAGARTIRFQSNARFAAALAKMESMGPVTRRSDAGEL